MAELDGRGSFMHKGSQDEGARMWHGKTRRGMRTWIPNTQRGASAATAQARTCPRTAEETGKIKNTYVSKSGLYFHNMPIPVAQAKQPLHFGLTIRFRDVADIGGYLSHTMTSRGATRGRGYISE